MPTEEQPHFLLLTWLIFITTMLFGIYLVWDQHFFALLFASDQSRISIAVALLFGLGCLHAAVRVIRLSSQVHAVDRALAGLKPGDVVVDGGTFRLPAGRSLPAGPVSDFLNDVLAHSHRADSNPDSDTDSSDLADIFAEELKRSHEYGWYVVDILVKLGLLGTIIGFILMLGSIADTSQLDVNTMQKVLTQMSSGMGTALYTTLAGLSASILLGAQYLMADKGADALLARVLKFAHLMLGPAVRGAMHGER